MLGRLGTWAKSAEDLLTSALSDNDPAVREAASQALGTLNATE